MKTIKINADQIERAADALKNGKLVAFPTETVYGLGANALDEKAVEEIFKVKQRPNDKSLIVLIGSKESLNDYVLDVSPLEEQLIQQFWPGPLTIVFDMKPNVFPSNINHGSKTVAVRMPGNDLTLKLIQTAGVPLVGPSANISGAHSPTTYEHVSESLTGKIWGIVDNPSARTDIGIESTIVRCHEEQITILRSGAITRAQLEKVTSAIVVDSDEVSDTPTYHPTTPVISMPTNYSATDWKKYIDELHREMYAVGVMADSAIVQSLLDHHLEIHYYILNPDHDLPLATQAAQRFYDGLHQLDQADNTLILVQQMDTSNMGQIFNQKLLKVSTAVL